MKALAPAAPMPPKVQLRWCSTTHRTFAGAGRPQPGHRPCWGNNVLPHRPGSPTKLMFAAEDPHSLDACLFTLTCGSTRRDFSLQEEAWRFTWAPAGRPGSSSACGRDGRESVLKHSRGHRSLARAPQGIFCSLAAVVGEGEPLSHTHLNLLIGDVIVHHAGRVWLVVLGGAGPPAGGGMGSSFPGHPCQPPSKPFHLRGLPALLSQLHSRALYPTLLCPTLLYATVCIP